jgi:glycosyltransferase involved in cell wall biosynthesis
MSNNSDPQREPIASATPIRILQIIDRLNIGGPAKHMVWLTQGLNNGQHRSRLITGSCAEGEGDMTYLARQSGIDLLVIPQMSRELGLQDLVVLWRLLREMWRWQPDVIHTHKSKAGAVGRVAACIYKWLTPSALWLRPRRCRVIHTFHGHIFHSYYGPMKTRLFIAIERLLARLCTDRIITISRQQRQEICEEFQVGRPEQHRMVPLGIELSEIATDQAFREELRASEDELLVGIVGRLSEVKNHAMFLASAAEFLRGNSTSRRCRFVIVGDGHLRSDLERQAGQLHIAGQVVFTGFRHDTMRLYSSFDVVALTSLNEGTPVTLIEAMACGRAVVSTEVGGVVDLMGAREDHQDGFTVWENGITVRKGDSQGLARALRYLVDRPELSRQMGARGCAYINANFSRERLLRDTAGVYQEAWHTRILPPLAAAQI